MTGQYQIVLLMRLINELINALIGQYLSVNIHLCLHLTLVLRNTLPAAIHCHECEPLLCFLGVFFGWMSCYLN